MTLLPKEWSRDEWTEVPFNGGTIRVRGLTFDEYRRALDGAVKNGATGTSQFARFLRKKWGADVEVVTDAAR